MELNARLIAAQAALEAYDFGGLAIQAEAAWEWPGPGLLCKLIFVREQTRPLVSRQHRSGGAHVTDSGQPAAPMIFKVSFFGASDVPVDCVCELADHIPGDTTTRLALMPESERRSELELPIGT